MTDQAPASPPAPQAAPGASQAAHVTGERHVSAVAGRGASFDRRKGAMVLLCAAGAACAFIILRPKDQPADPNKVPDDRLQVHEVARYEPPPLPVTPATFNMGTPAVTPPPLPTQPTNLPNLGQQQPDPMAKARRAPLLTYTAGGGSSGGQEAGAGPVTPGAVVGGPPGELAARLQATPLTGVTASVLRHQPYLLTEGTMLPCVLQNAMDSSLPGFVNCIMPQEVVGKTGIVLLDRGTRIFGEYQGGMRQGQNRLFVLWTRAETPKGVIINLNSPGTDPLGRAGFDGELDTHFWARFGGALMLSVVQGGIQAGVAKAAPQGSTYVNTGSVENVAGDALNNSVNIPPTLRKNQGELVSIMVARDLDFSTAYEVRTAAPGVGAGYP